MQRLATGVVALVIGSGAVLHAGPPHVSAPGRQRADQYRVKAAFLFNFAKFVEWPASSFNAPSAPLDVCVIGVDPFGSTLDETLRGRLVAGHTLVVRRIAEPDPSCHVLFVSDSERQRLAFIADQLRSASVLTVSEDEGFIAAGGMIELVTDGDSVQFNISPSAVEKSGLRASARLIALAANQRHGGGRR